MLNSAADITVPANVTKIADKAFYGLSSMETVTFLGNVTSIGVDASANASISKASRCLLPSPK